MGGESLSMTVLMKGWNYQNDFLKSINLSSMYLWVSCLCQLVLPSLPAGPERGRQSICSHSRSHRKYSLSYEITRQTWSKRTETGSPSFFMVMQIPFFQSLCWRCPADQKARRLWVRDWPNSQTKYITLLASLRKWTLSYGHAEWCSSGATKNEQWL